MAKKTVTVVGGGPAGLSMAIELATNHSCEVTVYDDPENQLKARDKGIGIIEDPEFPAVEGFPELDLHQAYLETDELFRRIVAEGKGPWAEILRVQDVSYHYRGKTDFSGFQSGYAEACNVEVLNQDTVRPHLRDADFDSGVRFSAPILNIPAAIELLRKQAAEAGVTLIDERAPAFETLECDIFVEAIGARRGFPEEGSGREADKSVGVKRGQTLVLKGDHGLTEVIGEPRDDISVNVVAWTDELIVVGATKELNDTEVDHRPETAEELMKRARVLFPGVDDLELQEHRVGFRPIRDTPLISIDKTGTRTNVVLNGFGGGFWCVSGSLPQAVAQRVCAA